MTYDNLVSKVSAQSGIEEKMIRDVLFAVPDVLLHLKRGERVRTPLGVFRLIRRAARKVRPLDGSDEPIQIPAEFVVKLKAGNRLRRET